MCPDTDCTVNGCLVPVYLWMSVPSVASLPSYTSTKSTFVLTSKDLKAKLMVPWLETIFQEQSKAEL
jgi:hypothetical protein